MKYQPDHPDADKNGFVAYPNIDETSQYATFNATAIKLKLLALARVCDSEALVDSSDSSFAIRYNEKSASGIKEDIFNLSHDHMVVSWMRQDVKGRATTVDLSSHAKKTSPSQND